MNDENSWNHPPSRICECKRCKDYWSYVHNMTRKVNIGSCGWCPSKMVTSSEEVDDIPYCGLMGKVLPHDTLPHEIHSNFRGKRIAMSLAVIPDWCPLERAFPDSENEMSKTKGHRELTEQDLKDTSNPF